MKAKKSKKRFGFLTSLFGSDSNEPIHDVGLANHPGIELEDRESLEKLMLIIQNLPEKQKTAIILTKIEDRPQQEVAEIMGTSVKAVESLIQRAKAQIEKQLKRSEGF
ncbi:RNA polymerase sigma factor [Algoriphagus marinus]|uniref:RNA polymerase sigma factor n=1 Tax=Algoriphagus marinus TaxID=1925762 RepID=UPI001FE35AB1|nr:RNA polymerase sigma factor [Algoriphagus marinus]